MSISGLELVTDAGLAGLSSLRRLVSLRIIGINSFADITDEGLETAVVAMPQLLYLDILADPPEQRVGLLAQSMHACTTSSTLVYPARRACCCQCLQGSGSFHKCCVPRGFTYIQSDDANI